MIGWRPITSNPRRAASGDPWRRADLRPPGAVRLGWPYYPRTTSRPDIDPASSSDEDPEQFHLRQGTALLHCLRACRPGNRRAPYGSSRRRDRRVASGTAARLDARDAFKRRNEQVFVLPRNPVIPRRTRSARTGGVRPSLEGRPRWPSRHAPVLGVRPVLRPATTSTHRCLLSTSCRPHQTACPYKGVTKRYGRCAPVIRARRPPGSRLAYDYPPAAGAISRPVAFYNEKLDIDVDGNPAATAEPLLQLNATIAVRPLPRENRYLSDNDIHFYLTLSIRLPVRVG